MIKNFTVLLMLFLSTTVYAAGDYFAGYAAYQSKDYYNAYKEWAGAAEAGDPRAMYRIGKMFEKGVGLPKQPAYAKKMYRSAANKGHKASIKTLVAMADAGDRNAKKWVDNHPKQVDKVLGSKKKVSIADAELEAEKEELSPFDFIGNLLK